jgi:predicted RNase H-like HicB family nuclease
MKSTVTVILEPEEDGGYSTHCPAIPGCHSQGNTLEDTLANIQEAIIGMMKVGQKEGLPPPKETPAIVADEIREILLARAEDGLPLIVETRVLAGC